MILLTNQQNESNTILGFDIGGTKCAAILGAWVNQQMTILDKRQCETDHTRTAEDMLGKLFILTEEMDLSAVSAVGFSCSGPLDASHGIVMSPPNLPGWDHIPVAAMAQDRFGCPTYLENDASACALAEWRAGAGRGLSILVDLLSPERIVLRIIFARAHNLLWPTAERFLQNESLAVSLACCNVVPSELGDAIDN